MSSETRPMTPTHPRWPEFVQRMDGPEGCHFRKVKLPGKKKKETTWRCGGGTDKTYAIEILTAMGFTRAAVARSLVFFEQHGGHCDCEILFNVEASVQVAAEDAVAAHYARDQAGLCPPPVPPYGDHATFQEAWVTHRRWLAAQPIAPTPQALSDSPPEGRSELMQAPTKKLEDHEFVVVVLADRNIWELYAPGTSEHEVKRGQTFLTSGCGRQPSAQDYDVARLSLQMREARQQ